MVRLARGMERVGKGRLTRGYMTEAEAKLREAQAKLDEAIKAATAQAQEKLEEAIKAQADQMIRKMMTDMLGGKVDMAQMASILQGLMGRLQAQDSPYRVLGLDPSAEDDVVRLAYRALSRKHHPDKGGSQEKMTEINRAYEAIGRERGWR